MVKIMVGLKGSGKTKRLVELVTKAVEEEQGDVICIEKDKNLTYDIPYQARLIHASDYNIGTFEFMKGFISGLRAGNYDISHIFIDNFHKMFNSNSEEQVVDFLELAGQLRRQRGHQVHHHHDRRPGDTGRGYKEIYDVKIIRGGLRPPRRLPLAPHGGAVAPTGRKIRYPRQAKPAGDFGRPMRAAIPMLGTLEASESTGFSNVSHFAGQNGT